MRKITKKAIQNLLDQSVAPAISIYMPTHRQASPPHLREDQTRYKNLIRRVEQIMAEADIPQESAKKIMTKLDNITTDSDFWHQQTDGLAIFVNPEMLTSFHLPISTDEYTAVDSHFHIAPIAALEQDNQTYLLVQVSQHNPKLFIGDMYGLEISDLSLPLSLEDALKSDELSQRQRHSRGEGNGMATGQHAGRTVKDSGTEERLKFFRILDDKIRQGIEAAWPMVLVGTSNEIAEFKQISKYPQLVDQSVEGSRSTADTAQLHKLSWPLVKQEVIRKRNNEMQAAFAELKAQNRSVDDPVALHRAAEEGRIETLMIRMYQMTRDTIKDSLKIAGRITFPTENLRRQIDECALLTWRNGGTILNLLPEEAPTKKTMAAILRY